MRFENIEKRKFGFSNILPFIVIIDLFFLPYIRQLSCLPSMLILLVWYVFNFLKIKRDNELYCIITTVVISALSLIFCYFFQPASVSSDWSSGNISPFSHSITYTIIFLFTYAYFVYFKTITPKELNAVEKALFVALMGFFAFAVLYIISPSLFFEIRPFWTLSGRITEATAEASGYYRFTGAFSDPNNAAAAGLALGIIIFENSKNQPLIRYISIFASIIIVLATSSTAGIISLALYLLFKFILYLPKQKRVRLEGVIIGIIFVLVLVLMILALFNTDVVQNAIERVSDNSGSADTRFSVWIRLLKNKGIFSYLIFGFGNAITIDGHAVSPHNGHLYLLYSYGFIVYLIFMCIFFKKPKQMSWNDYLYIIPLFICFTVNVGLIDARYTFFMASLIAYSQIKANVSV